MSLFYCEVGRKFIFMTDREGCRALEQIQFEFLPGRDRKRPREIIRMCRRCGGPLGARAVMWFSEEMLGTLDSRAKEVVIQNWTSTGLRCRGTRKGTQENWRVSG